MESAIIILLISLSNCVCSTILKVCKGSMGDQRDFDTNTAGQCYGIDQSIKDMASYADGFSWDEITYGYTESTPWEMYDEAEYAGNRWVFVPGVKVQFPKGKSYKSLRPACEYTSKGVALAVINENEINDLSNYNSENNIEVAGAMSDIFNARTIEVVAGAWEVYTETDYSGRREIVQDGNYVDRPNGAYIRSMRPECKAYMTNLKCKRTAVKLEEIPASTETYDGIDILGSVTGGSCSEGKGYLEMSSQISTSGVTTVSFAETESETTSVSVSKSIGFKHGDPLGIAEISGTGDTSAGWSKIKETESASSASESEGDSSNFGTTSYYNTPGAGVVFGIADRYIFQDQIIKRDVQYTCNDGSQREESETILLKKKKYQNVRFLPYFEKIENGYCDATLECILKIKDTFSNGFENEDLITQYFENCIGELEEVEMKNAAQSSQWGYKAPNLAIDGDSGTRSHTLNSYTQLQWWKASFENGVSNVQYIKLINGAYHRFNGARVYVTNGSDGGVETLCGGIFDPETVGTTDEERTEWISCRGQEGTGIKIESRIAASSEDTNSISLKEIKVYTTNSK